MSKLIRQLLDESDPLFALALSRLEKSAGNPGIDVRLTADIISACHSKMVTMGLDPSDTTGRELFASLVARFNYDNELLSSYLGHPATIDDSTKSIIKLAYEITGQRDTWAIKNTSLKRILKDNPPKRVMKTFHYQSVESFVKRMDPQQALLASRIVEQKTWWIKTKKMLSSLSSQDFEKKPLTIINLNDPQWVDLLAGHRLKYGSAVIASKESAIVGFCNLIDQPLLLSLVSLLNAINEVQLHGTYLKLHFVNPSIGNILVHAIDEGELIHTSISGVNFHWREIQRYFGCVNEDGEDNFLHLDINDLGWIQVEMALALKIPELVFWTGTDYLGVSYGEERTISMNLLDVGINQSWRSDYQHGTTKYLKRALKGELMARYLTVPSTRALVLKQFDISGSIIQDW